jgi:hypothetical protein
MVLLVHLYFRVRWIYSVVEWSTRTSIRCYNWMVACHGIIELIHFVSDSILALKCARGFAESRNNHDPSRSSRVTFSKTDSAHWNIKIITWKLIFSSKFKFHHIILTAFVFVLLSWSSYNSKQLLMFFLDSYSLLVPVSLRWYHTEVW